MLHVLIVGFLEGAGLDRVLDGENRVPLVDLRVVHDRHHGFQATLGDVEDAAHVVLHVVAGDGVLGQRGGGRGDGAVERIGLDRVRGRCWPVCGQGYPLSRRTKGWREGKRRAGTALTTMQPPVLSKWL